MASDLGASSCETDTEKSYPHFFLQLWEEGCPLPTGDAMRTQKILREAKCLVIDTPHILTAE